MYAFRTLHNPQNSSPTEVHHQREGLPHAAITERAQTPKVKHTYCTSEKATWQKQQEPTSTGRRPARALDVGCGAGRPDLPHPCRPAAERPPGCVLQASGSCPQASAGLTVIFYTKRHSKSLKHESRPPTEQRPLPGAPVLTGVGQGAT